MYIKKLKNQNFFYKNKISSSSIAGCPYLITFSLCAFEIGIIKILSAQENFGAKVISISVIKIFKIL